MATLSLSPAAREARAARKTASAMPTPSTAPPERTAQADGTLPATQEKSEPALSNKAAKKQAMRDLQRRLKAMWPHLFGRNDIPLAIGIRHDIAKHLSEEERRWLPAVLGRWVARGKYQQALMEPGAHRVDLQGNLSEITAEQVAHAKGV